MKGANEGFNPETGQIHLKSNDRDPILFPEDIVLSIERIGEYISGIAFQ